MTTRRNFLKALSLSGVAAATLSQADIKHAVKSPERTAFLVNPSKVRMEEIERLGIPIIRLRQRHWVDPKEPALTVIKW